MKWGVVALQLFKIIKLIMLRFTREAINDGERAINRLYGGLNPQVQNVLFVNGDDDPYQHLNAREPPNNRTYVINIPGKIRFFYSYIV